MSWEPWLRADSVKTSEQYEKEFTDNGFEKKGNSLVGPPADVHEYDKKNTKEIKEKSS